MVRSERRALALSAVLVAAVTMLLGASPAAAQVPPGTEAAVFVGGPRAVCPPGSPGALVPAGGTVGGVTVSGAGRCTPLAADAEGTYALAGFGPFTFTSQCANAGGTVQHSGGVEVPAGTIVGGAAVPNTTTITAENVPVVFPGGRTAILNQVISTPTSLTRNAIVFTGGPVVGQVVCGAAAYPLTVAAGGGETAAPPLTPESLSSSDGGSASWMLLAGAGILTAVVAQVSVGRRVRRSRGSASA